MNKYEHPITVANDMCGGREETTTTHPAFGQIRASRVSGHAFLYGSDFDHNHYVTISISRSELHRNLSRDWHFDRNELIEVALSEAQWATFVSSLNQGSGVPCTIQHKDGAQVPQLPETVKRKSQFDGELKETLAIVESSLAELEAKINAMPISAKAKKELLASLTAAQRNLSPNIKFVSDQFGEHMEDTIEKAKIEVEAYVNSAIHRAGVQALNEKKVLELT